MRIEIKGTEVSKDAYGEGSGGCGFERSKRARTASDRSALGVGGGADSFGSSGNPRDATRSWTSRNEKVQVKD